MVSMKLLLTVILLTGVFADQCSLSDLGIEDLRDEVVVTNRSIDTDAIVIVKSDHGQKTLWVPAGKSGTSIALASTAYTVIVTDPGAPDYRSYRDKLLATRDWLLDASISTSPTESQVAGIWTTLVFVQAALDQMTNSATQQSCSGKFETGVASQVTVRWAYVSNGMPLWALECG